MMNFDSQTLRSDRRYFYKYQQTVQTQRIHTLFLIKQNTNTFMLLFRSAVVSIITSLYIKCQTCERQQSIISDRLKSPVVGIGKKLQRERLTHGGLDDISDRHGDIVSQRRKTTNQHVVTLPKQLRGEERSAYQVTSLRMLIQQACQKRVFFICVFNKIIFYRKVIQMKEKICKEGNNSTFSLQYC